jgi:hypothetical protein
MIRASRTVFAQYINRTEEDKKAFKFLKKKLQKTQKTFI